MIRTLIKIASDAIDYHSGEYLWYQITVRGHFLSWAWAVVRRVIAAQVAPFWKRNADTSPFVAEHETHVFRRCTACGLALQIGTGKIA
jgi:hypothetical protein